MDSHSDLSKTCFWSSKLRGGKEGSTNTGLGVLTWRRKDRKGRMRNERGDGEGEQELGWVWGMWSLGVLRL